MKLLQTLLEGASDAKVYYGHVKRHFGSDPAFKAGKTKKGAIASCMHDIAEDDPKGINAGTLVAAVFAMYQAQYGAKKVAEGLQGVAGDGMDPDIGGAPKLSSKDRSFQPGTGGMGGGSGDDVAELKALRTKDIGDELTPEQQDELADLKSGGDMDDDDKCMDDGCCDPDCPEHGGECDDEDCSDEMCPTHGRDASSENGSTMGMKADMKGMSSDTMRGVSEAAEVATFGGWKAKVKKSYPSAWYEGDKDICQAFIGPKPYTKGETIGVGEWGGDSGYVTPGKAAPVKEGWDQEGAKTPKLSPKAEMAMKKRAAKKEEEEEVSAEATPAKIKPGPAKKMGLKDVDMKESILSKITRKEGSFLK